MSILNIIKVALGKHNTASENHFFDGSVANQLTLKKGTPAAPGADVMTVDSAGKVAFPATSGSVLQVAMGTDAGSQHSTISYVAHTGLKTFTPRSSSSTLLIEFSGRFLQSALAATNPSATFSIFENTISTLLGSELPLAATTSAGGIGVLGNFTIRAVVPNTVLTTRSFGLAGKTSSSSCIIGAQLLTWSITEVQN